MLIQKLVTFMVFFDYFPPQYLDLGGEIELFGFSILRFAIVSSDILPIARSERMKIRLVNY